MNLNPDHDQEVLGFKIIIHFKERHLLPKLRWESYLFAQVLHQMVSVNRVY